MPIYQVPTPSAAGLQPKYQKFTSSGTFTLPSGYGAGKPLLVQIQVIGGGGGGAPSRVNTSGNLPNYNVNATFANYFGQSPGGNYVINGGTIVHSSNTGVDFINTRTGKGGGSGGIAQTQMYLTENLSITVGAAGARPAIQNLTTFGIYSEFVGQVNTTMTAGFLTNGDSGGRDVFLVGQTTYGVTAGTGGTSTAGAVSSVGGVGATASGTLDARVNTASGTQMFFSRNANNSGTVNFGNLTLSPLTGGDTYAAGAAGQPAGSAGDAVPLLGALAGGSGSSTPVYGAFGVGGKKEDGATATGVEGTGGGFGSIGASGAVILTWWE